MKKLFLLLMILFPLTTWAQKEANNLSTLKIGPFALFMSQQDAEKIAGSKLVPQLEENDFEYINKVNYNGELIEITLAGDYLNGNGDHFTIYELSTKSKKFRTQSNMGVGSTKHELINAYKDYPNYRVSQGWTMKGDKDPDLSFFYFV